MRRVTTRAAALAAAVVALAGAGSPALAQDVRVALTADTVTVGDMFSAALRVVVPDGYSVEFPDSLGLGPELEIAGRQHETSAVVPGGTEVTMVYPMTAWRPGEHVLPALTVRLVGPDGIRDASVPLGVVNVRSVLPPDTAGVQPRPPRDVLGAERLLWPWVVAALLALLVATGLIAWWRWRSRAGSREPVSAMTPRDRALAALDRARALGLLEAGEFKTFYSMTSEAVRHFLASSDPAWGVDRTTSELVAILSESFDADDLVRVREALIRADLVKFARHRPEMGEALAEWQAIRDWVERFGSAASQDEVVTAEAA